MPPGKPSAFNTLARFLSEVPFLHLFMCLLMQNGQLNLNASFSNTDARTRLCGSACFHSAMCKSLSNTEVRLSLSFDL